MKASGINKFLLPLKISMMYRVSFFRGPDVPDLFKIVTHRFYNIRLDLYSFCDIISFCNFIQQRDTVLQGFLVVFKPKQYIVFKPKRPILCFYNW